MFDAELTACAETVIAAYTRAGRMIVTAESCTGGLIAGCLTEIAGSSAVLDRGFVTYADNAKTDLLSVPPGLIAARGAVSEEVCRAMLHGALAASPADVAIAVTGIAGPGGGSAEKPVGLVYVGIERRGRGAAVERHVFPGDRTGVRRATILRALHLLLENLA
jgi:nicotinamide-nucleotide amidase